MLNESPSFDGVGVEKQSGSRVWSVRRPGAAALASCGGLAVPALDSVSTPAHPAKAGSWSLLVVVSIVLVAGVKAYVGRLHGTGAT